MALASARIKYDELFTLSEAMGILSVLCSTDKGKIDRLKPVLLKAGAGRVRRVASREMNPSPEFQVLCFHM